MFGSEAPAPVGGTAFQPAIARPVTPSRPVGRGAEGNVIMLPTRAVAGPPAGQPEPRRSVELHVLGGFRLVIDGEIANVGTTGQRLLAVVACRGRQATRSQIAHALWPDVTSERALANLRTALYRLFRRGPGALHASNSYLQLSVGMQIDIEQTTKLANRILGSDVINDDALLDDVLTANLYDDLLPEWDDEWLADYQYRYRQLRLTALESLSGHLASIGHYGAAVQAALTAVQADQLRDSAHEALIRAYVAQGNRHEAYAHYMSYRRILRDELGLEPPPAARR